MKRNAGIAHRPDDRRDHPMMQARSTQTIAFKGVCRQRGFTLVELLTAVTVLSVLTAVAIPSFTNMMNRNRLAAQSNELLSAIQYARMEAIRSRARVTFCGAASADADEDDDCVTGEQPYWVVIGRAAGGGREQLRLFTVKAPLRVSTALEKISFTADGLARDSATQALVTGEITVCLETSNPALNTRVLNIASGSRVVITTAAGTCA
jgi:type IV fimbrial biogenesis protein FimT